MSHYPIIPLLPPPTKSLLPKSAPTFIVYVCGGGVSSCISSETRKCPRGWFLISFFFSKDHTSFQVRWTEGPLRRGTFFPTSQNTGELGTNTMLSKHRMEPLPSDAWVGSQAGGRVPLYGGWPNPRKLIKIPISEAKTAENAPNCVHPASSAKKRKMVRL